MGNQIAQKFDWPTIQARFELGETPGQISRSLGGRPTRQAMHKRSQRHGWQRQHEGVKDVDGQSLTIPVDDLSFAQKIVIEKVAEGVTQRTAAHYAGVNEATVSRWKKDVNFLKALRWALAVKTGNRLKVIEDSQDWRAKAWQLERDPDSRRDYGQATIGLVGGHNTINVLAGVDVGFGFDKSERVIESEAEEQFPELAESP